MVNANRTLRWSAVLVCAVSTEPVNDNGTLYGIN